MSALTRIVTVLIDMLDREAEDAEATLTHA